MQYQIWPRSDFTWKCYNFSKAATNASIAQWQSVGLVNQRSWVQSSLEANSFWSRKENSKMLLTPTWFEHAAFWSGVRRATVAPRSQVFKVPPRFELGSLDSKSRVLTITPWNPKVSVSTSIFDQHMSEMWDDCSVRRKENECFLPGSNRRPCACEAHVITTTLRKLWFMNVVIKWICYMVLFRLIKTIIPSGDRTQDLWIRSPTRYPLR